MSAQPQYSPDGRFYWDGARWLPVQVPKPQPWIGRGIPCATNAGCLIVIGIIIALAVIGLLLGPQIH